MNVLLINTFETKGGAAVAGKRLAVALIKNGVQATLLVKEKKTSDKNVFTIITSHLAKDIAFLSFLLERLQIFLINRFSRKNLFAISTASTGMSIIRNKLVKEADIIHIHWINQGFLSLKSIEKLIATGKPIVWTMHDMWPVTGICHHSRECDHYTKDCGNCFFLNNPSKNDLSFRVFEKKKRIIKGAGIQLVACSEWLQKRSEISNLIEGNLITNIPNPIDTERFLPGDKSAARASLNLPLDKKILFFGALIASDKRKGIDYLIEVTHLLKDLKEEVELVFCGEIKEKLSSSFGLKSHSLGYVTDPELIVKMYQAADCFVIPSLEENLPNMIMEAMSCGIPCVGFKTGGIPEMIQHKKTGYLSEYKSSEDFANGIRYVLANSEEKQLSVTSREFVLANYSEESVSNRYIEIYNSLITNRKL